MNMVEQQIECKTCQWNKFCIEPPSMTEEEIKEKTKLPEPAEIVDKDKAEGKLMGSLLTNLFFAGKDRECTACPVFIGRLRSSSDLSTRIKEIMQSY